MTARALHFEISGPLGKQITTLAGPGPHWLGRDSGCAITLAESNVSRRHVAVEVVSDGLQVTDASSNGTLVDELLLRRATRIIPKCSGTLGVGPFQIRFFLCRRSGAAAPKRRACCLMSTCRKTRNFAYATGAREVNRFTQRREYDMSSTARCFECAGC